MSIASRYLTTTRRPEPRPAPSLDLAARFELLLALGLSTSLAGGLVFLRLPVAGQLGQGFMLWNLLLAWIPLLLALGAEAVYAASPRLGRISLPLWIGLWLLFFPNAPYIVTDLIHLRPANTLLGWYDLLTLVSAAFAGLMLGYASLRLMHSRARAAAGPAAGWAFALAALALSGFGVYLGRFQRWNSWDLLHQPRQLLLDILERLTHPEVLGFSLLFALFGITAYWSLTTFARLQAPDQNI